MSSSITPSIGSSHGSRRARFSCRNCWRRLLSLIAGLCRRIWRRRAEPVVEIPLSELQAIRSELEAQPGDPDCALKQGLGPDDPTPEEEAGPLSAPPSRSSSRRTLKHQGQKNEPQNCLVFFYYCCGCTLLWSLILWAFALKSIQEVTGTTTNSTTLTINTLQIGSKTVLGSTFFAFVMFFAKSKNMRLISVLIFLLPIVAIIALLAKAIACGLTENIAIHDWSIFFLSIVLLISWILLFVIKLHLLKAAQLAETTVETIELTQQVTVAAGSADPENGESTSDPHEQGGPSTVACSVSSEPPKEDDEKEGCSASDPKA